LAAARPVGQQAEGHGCGGKRYRGGGQGGACRGWPVKVMACDRSSSSAHRWPGGIDRLEMSQVLHGTGCCV